MAALTSIALGALAAATAMNTMQQGKAAKAQQRAGAQAAEQAAKQAATAEQEFNKANQRKPDSAAMMSANQAAARAGNAGTMLTGAMGVDPSTLQLGRNTLLGQ